MSQTCCRIRNDSIEDSEVDNRLKKIHFADLVMQSQLQVFLLPANFKSDGMMSHEKTKTVSFLE